MVGFPSSKRRGNPRYNIKGDPPYRMKGGEFPPSIPTVGSLVKDIGGGAHAPPPITNNKWGPPSGRTPNTINNGALPLQERGRALII